MPTAAWTDALDALKIIQSTHKIAKEVPEACTIVVQRKLASTVPPRPMVNLAFDEAAASLEKMLNNNLAALKVLDYSSGTNLYVCCCTIYKSSKKANVKICRIGRSISCHRTHSRCRIQGRWSAA